MFDKAAKKLFATVEELTKKVERLEKRVTDIQYVRTAVAAAPIKYGEPVVFSIRQCARTGCFNTYTTDSSICAECRLREAAQKAYARFTPGTKVQHRTLKVEEVFFNGITTLTDVRRIRSMTGSVIPRPHGFPVEGKQGRFIWWMTDTGSVYGSYVHNLTVL